MSTMESRRDFLKKSSVLLGGAAVLGTTGVLTGCAKSEPEKPAHPYPYKELDLDAVQQAGYKAYFDGGCCFGAAEGLLSELRDKVGYPYTMMDAAIFANGGGGYTTGSLCGALGGSAAVFGMCCEPADAKALMKELIKWYTTTALPQYRPETDLDVQTVSPSANCADSVGTFLTATGAENGSDTQRFRCGGLTGDVARKAAELLNIHYGFAKAPETEAPTELVAAANEYFGEAKGFGEEPIKVKVTMDGDQIAKIDVLSHGETEGVSDPAFASVPEAIIKAQSTKVDVAAGATYSSNGIMAAVEDALSKVGK